MKAMTDEWSVIDLFSGAGGMSFGFHAHKRFQVIAAADAQNGKPSSGKGTLECNATFKANIGIEPLDVDLARIRPKTLFERLGSHRPDVLIACAPCTGFSRTLSHNHLTDDPRNSLVVRTGEFVERLRPSIFLMENARELLQGNFTHHFDILSQKLDQLGYEVEGQIHFLNNFGLPQRRERALIVAVEKGLHLRTLEELWDGITVQTNALTVRRAIGDLPPVSSGSVHPDDPLHVSPSFNEKSLLRLKLIPTDGGSWINLREVPEAEEVLTPAMKRYIAQGKFGSHPDVYGRLWWDRPAITIKRECGHTGNGRYAHPEQDRLCTVRELSILQGFPADFKFTATSVGNMYRHIGDAVPPLISYQLAHVCEWILAGRKPPIRRAILPKTHLKTEDVVKVSEYQQKLSFGSDASVNGRHGPRTMECAELRKKS